MVCGIFTPFSLMVTVKAEAWNGETAKGFASGSGTKADPYLISTPTQLAYFCKEVNGGRDFSNQYITLVNDIYINDESFTLDADGDRVMISDGDNTVYVTIVEKDDGEDDKYPITDLQYAGALNRFEPIGIDKKHPFNGHFDGEGHCIAGLYINNSKFLYAGLFGYGEGSVTRLRIENSLVVGSELTGSVAGKLNAISDCYSSAFVKGKSVGGLLGTGVASYCVWEGKVNGEYVGGVVCNGSTAHCISNGIVYGKKGAGGIVYDGMASYCVNTGSVFDVNKNKQNTNVGGIVGNGSAVYCTNKGTVTGYCAGGIAAIAPFYDGDSVSYSVNYGQISGSYEVGGIVGRGNAENCSNHGSVQGSGSNTGGIVGKGSAAYCFNTAPILGYNGTGGICGSSAAKLNAEVAYCYNTGSVTGENAVGGITGASGDITVTNCYNTADVKGFSTVGGIAAGSVGSVKSIKLEYCYNVGNVTGSDKLGCGGILGSGLGYQAEKCYYRKGCAVGTSGKVFLGIGMQGTSVLRDPNVIELSDGWEDPASFAFDFENVWKMGSGEYTYPILQKVHLGEHTFSLVEHLDFLRREPDCTEGDSYYHSCSCGVINTEYSYVGEPKHSYTGYMADDMYHYHLCVNCHTVADKEAHTLGMGKTMQDDSGRYALYACSVCQKQVSLPLIPDAQKIPLHMTVLYIAVGCVLGALLVYTVITVRFILRKSRLYNKSWGNQVEPAKKK